MKALPPIRSLDLSGGLASYASDDLLPSNDATLSVNFHYDLLGDATQRNGTTALGAQVSAGNACDGISQFISSDQTKNKLVAAFNGTNYAFDGTTWTNVGGGMAAGTAVHYASFLNLLFRVGGGAVTASYDGGAGPFGGTNTGGAPTGKYLMPYKQRLYIAGDASYPNRLWFSTIATFGGSITWDTTASSAQFIDFTAGKANDVITGLGKISNRLLIFLNNAMYRYDGTSTDPEIIVDIGCSSQDSITQCKGYLFFFNPNGIFMTNGEYPQEISRKINDWIQGIPTANYSKISSASDADHAYFYVGDVTRTRIANVTRTFKNVMLVYTISSQNWQVYSFGNNFKFFTTYADTSNTVQIAGGESTGYVLRLFNGNTDFSAKPIVYEYESTERYWDSRATSKVIMGAAFHMLFGVGGQAMIAPDGLPFQTIGQIRDVVTIYPTVNVSGHTFVARLQGSNTSTPVVFKGWEIFEARDLGYVRQGDIR